MDKDRLIQRLMATFLGELEEHVRALNRDLLALEKEPAPPEKAELYKTLFRTAHSLKGAARSVSIAVIESACHRLEDIFAAARDGLLPLREDLFELLFRTADAIQEAGRRLREKQDVAGSMPATLLSRLEAAARGGAGPQSKATTQPPSLPGGEIPPGPSGGGFVRIPAEKLDVLLARSGELLVTRNRTGARQEEIAALVESVKRWQGEWPAVEKVVRRFLPHNGKHNQTSTPREAAGSRDTLSRRVTLALGRSKEYLRRLGRDLERLAAGLAADGHALEQAAGPVEEEVRRIRMLPFATVCEGFERTVRDLARAGGKETDLIMEGGELELDRSILENLKDPLLHLVRNAVDHGIEPVADRLAGGKPGRGRITVAAKLRGNHIEVVVADDGRGLDLDSIREQARRRQLPEPADEKELARFILLTGFSTSPIITELSGRGVGLDIVKTRVEALLGTLDFSFEPGRGTRFTLTVPLTLTTIRGLLVKIGEQTFALAGSSVQRLLRVGPEDLHSMEGREVLLLGEKPVPVVPLAGLLGLDAREPVSATGRIPVVVLSGGGQLVGVTVDELIAEQEVVVKSLGPRLARVRGIAGATVLPTGRVALILNAAELIRNALGFTPTRTLSVALAPAEAQPRKRLLVVDDSVTTRTLVRSILESAGYEVIVAVDGAEAWQLLQEKGADLMVADVDMPRMDGFALTEAVRGSKRFRNLPVVLVTALETEKDRARGMEVGADAYLLKSSFDQKNLLETIAQLL